MRVVNKTKWTTLLILGMVLSFFASCEKDKNEGGDANDLIVGTWTLQSTTADVKINNMSVVDYIMSALGMTREQAEAFAESYGSDEILTGTISFNADGTYSANIGGEPDSGTYKISSDGKTVTVDEGTDDEMIMNIVSITSTTLIVDNVETEEIDLDQNGSPDTLSTSLRMTFTK